MNCLLVRGISFCAWPRKSHSSGYSAYHRPSSVTIVSLSVHGVYDCVGKGHGQRRCAQSNLDDPWHSPGLDDGVE